MAVTKFTTTQVGTTTQYTVTFEVIDAADIDVYVDGVLQLQQNTTSTAAADHPQVVSGEITQGTALINYTVASNNGSITFNQAPDVGAFLIIERTTDDTLLETFVSGGTIRAQDLNNAFERVLFIAQEGVGIADEALGPAEDEDNAYDALGNRISNVANATDDDDAVNRGQLGKVITDDLIAGEGIDLTDATGGTNSNKQVTVSAEFSTDSNPGIITVDATTPITRTYSANGQLDLSIADGAIDTAKIKPSQIITSTEQDAGASVSNTSLFTSSAAARRFDTVVQTSTPTGSAWETGKTWYQNDEDKTVYVWDGDSWEAITSGGAFTRLDKVIYVDAVNGDDTNNGHRISTPKRSIGAALDDINGDATYGDGSVILVAPGVYEETAPLDIQKKDVSIIGAALRSTIVHPTSATETESLFRVNSGTYLQNLTFSGVKASGTRGHASSIDPDATYGLPETQGWNISFYPDAMIYKSPYIQNCTNFSDSEIDNDNFNAHTPAGGAAGDTDSQMTGGGLLVDGSTVHDDSPLRSIVADSYTHVGLDGPGILVTNNGYVQVTSSYAFFNHYHIKCRNGGQANLAASTTDFGRYSLVADGRSTSAVITANVNGLASSGSTTFDIDNVAAGSNWHGSATRPQDNMLVDVGGNTYPVLSATAITGGWRVEISRPNTNDRTQNLGLDGDVADNASVEFFLRSMIASSGHTMEYVGSGTNYGALPENGGVPNDNNQVIELNNGKVWTAITDHNGTFKVGGTFEVNQQTGFVSIPAGALSVSTLLEDLNVNGKAIKTDATNQDIVLDPNGTGTVNVSTSRITNVVDPTGAQDASTKNYVDTELNNLTTSSTAELNILDGATLNTSELNILDGATLDTNELNQLDGATLTDNPTWTSSTQFPSAASINTRFLGLLNALGGFVAIANENSFPNDNPDPSDGAGTVVSIADAGGMSISASGVGTGQTLGGSTVTITGFPASFNSSTLPAQQGLQVQTTTTLNTYTYHKVIARDDDIVRLNDDVNDFFQRYRFGASNPTTDNDAGDLFFNTGSGTMLVWDTSGATAEWKEVQSIGEFFVIPASDFPTWNGTINDITITNNAPANASQIILSINGVVQEPNTGTARPTDGFALDGSVIRLSDAPASGSEAWGVIIGSTVNIGEPSANTVSSAKIVDGAVIEAKLGTGSVTSGKIAADAVNGTKIADDSIDSEHYVDGSIDTAHIADDAVTAAKLADTAVTAGSYTAADITVDAQGRITAASSGTISTAEIADDAVTAAKLADTTVTPGSYTLSSITVDQQGRITAASSGTAADPDIITEGNTSVEVVDTGSNGEVRLTTEGTRAMTIDSSQRVGIGITTPSAALNVEAATPAMGSDGLLMLRGNDTAAADNGGQISFGYELARLAGIAGRSESSSGTAGYLQFGTRTTSGDITERFRIGPVGQLGIGGANFGNSGQVLTSQGNAAAPQWAAPPEGFVDYGSADPNGISIINITGISTNCRLLKIYIMHFSSSNNNSPQISLRLGNGSVSSASYTGRVFESNSNTTQSTGSDRINITHTGHTANSHVWTGIIDVGMSVSSGCAVSWNIFSALNHVEFGAARWNGNNTIDRIQLIGSAGNWDGGFVRVFGDR